MLLNELLVNLSYQDLDRKVVINFKNHLSLFCGNVDEALRCLSETILTRDIILKYNIENKLYIDINIEFN